MKIDIITFHFVSNCGGVLQCFATQKFLEKHGYEVSIIDYRPEYHVIRYKAFKNPFIYIKYYSKQFQGRSLPKKVLLAIRAFGRCIYLDLNASERNVTKLFEGFIKKNFNLTQKYVSIEQLKRNPPVADVYITGSDQLWNPDLLNGDFDPAYFLKFGPMDIPRISYAVSSGRELSTQEISKLKALSDALTAISMREYSAQIAKVIERDIHVCIDPTLLLDAEDYYSIESKITESEPYIFVYGFENTSGLHDALEIAKGKYQCHIINGSPHRIKLDDPVQKLRDYGPDRFLSLIKNAECVVTNSFHGTAFAIIYKKDFITISHSTRGGRMTNLLYNLGLSSRLWGSSDFDFRGLPDYETIEDNKSLLRMYSSNYLLEAIDGKRGEDIPHMPREYDIS